MRFALVVGNSEYDDSTLARLNTPVADTQALAKALNDPALGQFDSVTTIINQSEPVARRGISLFLAQKKPDDLVLLYFSCHGLLDDRGRLYLAAKDTQSDLLKATGISASFITDEMDSCRSRRQVLILDCCYGGAFARGTKSADAKALTQTTFEGAGYGRVVLTASDSTQFALEGDQVVEQAETSLFTHFLLDGLTSGDADLDKDGKVTLDELYDYTYNRVVSQTPRQTPCKWSYNQQGDLVIAKNPRPIEIKPAELPVELREALENPYSTVRLGAVEALKKLVASSDPGMILSAKMALERLRSDDSRSVSEAADRLLTPLEGKISSDAQMTSVRTAATAAAPSTLPKAPTTSEEKPAVVTTHEMDRPVDVPRAKDSLIHRPARLTRNFWLGWAGALAAGYIFTLVLYGYMQTLDSSFPNGFVLLDLLSLGLIGAVIGAFQWFLLRHKVSWAGWWWMLNIAVPVGIGGFATAAYDWWGIESLGSGLLVIWLVVNLIVGPWLVSRHPSSLLPGGDSDASVGHKALATHPQNDWRVWLQWLGWALLVVLVYLMAYEGKIRENTYLSSFMFFAFGVTGGVAGILQWSLLSRYRSGTAAWIPVNIVILEIVAVFTRDDPTIQYALMFSWLLLNVVVGVGLVYRKSFSARDLPDDAPSLPKPGVVFWLVWIGMPVVGIALAFLAKMAIDSTGGDNSPANYFLFFVVLGLIIGMGQWSVLRRWLNNSWLWIAINVVCLGWVGFALSPYHSDNTLGDILALIYILSNLAVGPWLVYTRTLSPKPAG